MSPQMMGKSSRPDKKGIGEQWEENLRIKERGMGAAKKSPAFGPAKPQWRTTQRKEHIEVAVSCAQSVRGARHEVPVLIIFQKPRP